MKILVLGASGQVARQLKDLLPDAVYCGRSALDLNDVAAIERAVRELMPTGIINAAAYTAVDCAEREASTAWRINAEAPAAIARAAENLGISLVHISTDYVFDGTAALAYSADAPARPLNVYGRSKLAGEAAVSSLCSRFWIFRTSWVFSEDGSNFVQTMLRLGASRESLEVVDDQLGRPTYAGHLARLIATLMLNLDQPAIPWGVYHAVGGPVVSWCGFARNIFARARALGILPHEPEVIPIPSASFPTAARRPLKAVLEPSIALRTLTHPWFDWRDGLEQTLVRIRAYRLGV